MGDWTVAAPSENEAIVDTGPRLNKSTRRGGLGGLGGLSGQIRATLIEDVDFTRIIISKTETGTKTKMKTAQLVRSLMTQVS
jgi:hypothetical protein